MVVVEDPVHPAGVRDLGGVGREDGEVLRRVRAAQEAAQECGEVSLVCDIGVREALEAAAERHHHLWASDGSDGGGGAGERSGRQRRGPRGDLRALPRLNGLYRLH